jgi:propanol-preferring alcohol dehydrogenase
MLPGSMLTMTVDTLARRLHSVVKPVPQARDHELVVRVLACGVCRTDLHIIDADLAPLQPDIVPGHEVVGEVMARGAQARRLAIGQRIGIAWLEKPVAAARFAPWTGKTCATSRC